MRFPSLKDQQLLLLCTFVHLLHLHLCSRSTCNSRTSFQELIHVYLIWACLWINLRSPSILLNKRIQLRLAQKVKDFGQFQPNFFIHFGLICGFVFVSRCPHLAEQNCCWFFLLLSSVGWATSGSPPTLRQRNWLSPQRKSGRSQCLFACARVCDCYCHAQCNVHVLTQMFIFFLEFLHIWKALYK